MPTTRRSAGGAAGKQQSTLSFNHRVTKPVPKSAKSLVSTTPTTQSPLGKHVLKAEEAEEEDEKSVDIDEATKAANSEQQQAEAAEKKSEAELRAQKIGDRRIEQYWRGLESERMTRRVHQEDLSLAEKVLRYWDVSSQYGIIGMQPCVGISRMKRWQRADRLGLKPPVEVLAVLLREERKNTEGIERAHIDEILNSTASVGVS
ncbi:hypothetical protein SLS62_002859 [Diatrype stigma]|uniref:DNA polymerase delta subunit 4 n=1 Tax=Diatrype stigma TaxID=117547 RepID=A0AAN9YUQ3_9PEZI